MKRKKALLIAVVLIISVGMSGCGTINESEKTTGGEIIEEASTEEETPAENEGVTKTYETAEEATENIAENETDETMSADEATNANADETAASSEDEGATNDDDDDDESITVNKDILDSVEASANLEAAEFEPIVIFDTDEYSAIVTNVEGEGKNTNITISYVNNTDGIMSFYLSYCSINGVNIDLGIIDDINPGEKISLDTSLKNLELPVEMPQYTDLTLKH